MIIQEIKPRRKRLYALVISPPPSKSEFRFSTDSTGLLVLDANLCAERNITGGMSISVDELKNLVSESYLRRAKERALWYLSRSDCSAKELTQKLCRADFPKEVAQAVTERMKELGYINDERYAERLAESYILSKKVAPRLAVSQMIAKGIDSETAKQAIQATESDSVEIIRELIEKKYQSKLKSDDGVKKVIAALCRRGFSFSDIRQAIKKFDLELEYTED